MPEWGQYFGIFLISQYPERCFCEFCVFVARSPGGLEDPREALKDLPCCGDGFCRAPDDTRVGESRYDQMLG